MQHPRPRSALFVIAAMGMLAGCGIDPQPPGLLVNTAPPGASCTVSRAGQPLTTAEPTPAIARFAPAEAPVTVSCHRAGFADATVTVPMAAGTPPGAVNPDRVDIALTPLPGSAPR